MFLSLVGCWNCHSTRACMDSSLDNIGSWSQSIDISFPFIWELFPFNTCWCETSWSSRWLVCGGEREVKAGMSTSWKAGSPSTGCWSMSSWLERSFIFGSGPRGFAGGSRLLYCLRRAVCQLSRLTWALLEENGNQKVRRTRTTPYDHKTRYTATYA